MQNVLYLKWRGWIEFMRMFFRPKSWYLYFFSASSRLVFLIYTYDISEVSFQWAKTFAALILAGYSGFHKGLLWSSISNCQRPFSYIWLLHLTDVCCWMHKTRENISNVLLAFWISMAPKKQIPKLNKAGRYVLISFHDQKLVMNDFVWPTFWLHWCRSGEVVVAGIFGCQQEQQELWHQTWLSVSMWWKVK